MMAAFQNAASRALAVRLPENSRCPCAAGAGSGRRPKGRPASATNMARFPALGSATGAKINRFVFRKNPEDAKAATDGATVTPAAGGSVLQK